MWLRYTRIMSVFPLESRRVVNLNIALLFFVSIEPFLFNLIKTTELPAIVDPLAFADTTSTLFAIDLAAMFGILGVFAFSLADDERKLIARSLMRQYRIEGAMWFLSGLVFAVSALPFFFAVKGVGDLSVREDIWVVPLIFLYVGRLLPRLGKS